MGTEYTGLYGKGNGSHGWAPQGPLARPRNTRRHLNVLHDALPVIVGVSHVSARPSGLDSTNSPVGLIGNAVQDALSDAHVLPGMLDALYLAHVASWRYADPSSAVADHIGATPAIRYVAPSGGQYPTRLLVQAAADVHSGRIQMAVVAGGEAACSRIMYARAKVRPPWPEQQGRVARPDNGISRAAEAHGLSVPTSVYPLFEVARRAAADPSPAVGHERSARIQANLSSVAERTPGAWLPRCYSPEQIATPGRTNRWIAWPYPKLMCANPQVDQAAAAIVTTVGHARRLGIPLDSAVYIWGGAATDDELDLLRRSDFTTSPGLAGALAGACELADCNGTGFEELELYSCFPVVPWAATTELGVDLSRPLTTAGGLTFFGGPASSYMCGATTAMVRRLRERPVGTIGLLYGNGLFMTKHHALVVATAPSPSGRFAGDRKPPIHSTTCVQSSAPSGPGHVESCTVLADQDGRWTRGIVVGRLDEGTRFVANTPADDDTFAVLTSMARHPVGLVGAVTHDDLTGLNMFTLTGDAA
jgi:acetyl-CoA C-acetyltransferase